MTPLSRQVNKSVESQRISNHLLNSDRLLNLPSLHKDDLRCVQFQSTLGQNYTKMYKAILSLRSTSSTKVNESR